MVCTHHENANDTQTVLRIFLYADAEEKYRPLKPAVKRLLTDFCDPDLTVVVLAEEAHMSTTYFRKLFGELFDINPKKAISCLRLNYAKTLLANNAHPIETVAGMVGFVNAKYFSKLFKQEYGVSPLNLRRRYRPEYDQS